ncbi:MAG: AAA family ATPase, partial [Chitinispirillia bacterium]|nr:AAA family ATPase [Chitinispirillia bacterium]
MARLLPTGIQNFDKLRRSGHVYVDKTVVIHRLVSGTEGAYFLSRPRRFGKSLLCSTMEAVFEGKRELFGEIAGYPALAINSLEWGWKRHPVIRLDLSAEVYSNGVTALHAALYSELEAQYERLGIHREHPDVISQFKHLIRKACEKTSERVVVIIDEYDKPLLETIDLPELHEQIKKELKGFYGVLKSYDQYLRFVFITGVTKFSRVSVFSDLNQLTDLTLNPSYADICGLTQEEVERDFEPEIAAVLKETGRDRETYLENLRRFYNGYRFSKKPLTVYNPFGLLQHFGENGEFLSYWYETGTPTFLINLIKKQKIDIVKMDDMRVRHEDFRRYDTHNMRAAPMLYQCGYLTISDYNEKRNEYTLDYPNLEVSYSFANSLMEQYLQVPEDRSQALFSKLPDALEEGNIEDAINALRQFLAGVPYDIIKETENYYQTVVFLIFKILGLDCRAEVR